MLSRRRLTNAALALLLSAFAVLGAAGCGARAGDGQTNPPSTSPK